MSVFPTRILLATDGSEDAHLAARSAVNLADATGSELHVVHVGEHTLSPYYEDLIQGAERDARELLEGEVRLIEDSYGGEVAEAYVRLSHPDEKVVTVAQEMGAGLVVVGSRGSSGVRRLLVGSVSAFVVRHAPSPVMVARWRPVVFPTRVVVATDGSEEASLALDSASDLADKTGSELHLVHVWPVSRLYSNVDMSISGSIEGHKESRQAAQELLDEQVQRVERAGTKVTGSHMHEGDPDREIIRLAEELEAGLVALGSRGRGGIRRALMGSVSDSVVRHAHCPVLVVRPEE